MAVGDHPESSLLLPGGSRVEGFDVENIASAPASNRRRRIAVSFITTIAVVSCLATISVRSMTEETPIETLDNAAVSNVASKLTSNLPSWLQTPSVNLMPLGKLVQEQELVRGEAQGKISHKLVEEEHLKTGPSPHSLAMKNVAPHPQPVAASAPAGPAPAATAPAAGAAPVHHAHAHAAAAAAAKHSTAGAAAAAPAHAAPPAGAKKMTVEEELKAKQHALARLLAKEVRDETKVKKAELHRLAALKAKDGAAEKKLEGQISNLKTEEKKSMKLTNEKSQLKAEMARIEEEEHEKLTKLQHKMAALGATTGAAPVPAAAAAPAATAAAKAPSPAPAAPAAPAVVPARAHTVVAKKAVQVVHAAVPSKAAAEAASPTAARETQLAWGHESEAKKGGCTDDDCATANEDKKWLAHKKSVDQFAEMAMNGNGQAKAKALAHMRELQKQIENDYQHVTGFAVTQEHALPPMHQ